MVIRHIRFIRWNKRVGTADFSLGEMFLSFFFLVAFPKYEQNNCDDGDDDVDVNNNLAKK